MYRLGNSWAALAALVFTWSLITLSFIDYREHMLPDMITLSLLWLGLLANVFGLFTTTTSAILGAIIGYTSLWIIAKGYQFIRKKEGLGHGDFKMFAMIGAWLGIEMLVNVILTAVVTALVVSVILLLFKKITKKNPIPFGPYLAIGGWLTLFFGPISTNLVARIC